MELGTPSRITDTSQHLAFTQVNHCLDLQSSSSGLEKQASPEGGPSKLNAKKVESAP